MDNFRRKNKTWENRSNSRRHNELKSVFRILICNTRSIVTLEIKTVWIPAISKKSPLPIPLSVPKVRVLELAVTFRVVPVPVAWTRTVSYWSDVNNRGSSETCPLMQFNGRDMVNSFECDLMRVLSLEYKRDLTHTKMHRVANKWLSFRLILYQVFDRIF